MKDQIVLLFSTHSKKSKMRVFNFFAFLFLLLQLSACKVNHFIKASPTKYTVSDELGVEPDTAIQSLIAPYQERLEKEMSIQIGVLAKDMEKRNPESALGNLVADALKEKAAEYSGKQVDFAVSNSGGLRLPMLPKGPVEKADIYELLPFDNILVILELEGPVLMEFLDHIAAGGGWPVSKGIKFTILENKANKVSINGAPIDINKRYRVALPDYIANGGGRSSFLVKIPQESTGKYMRDAVIEYIQEQKGAISADLEGRIQIEN